jgi:hypothetical protein
MKSAPLLLALLAPCYAYYVAIDDDQFPAITMWNGQLVDWSTGVVAALLDTSTAVRISARGLHFYDHEIYPLSDPIPCRRTPDALCVMPSGNLVFPENTPPRYSFGATQCGASSAGRVIVDEPSVYDLSMCDLLEAQADVIWRDGSIYVDSKLQLPDWAYIATALAVLFLVISLGQNIARIMGDEHAVTQPELTEAVCIGLVILLMLINDPMRVFVALHDRVMLVVTASYLALATARQGFQLVFEPYVYTFNVITASLMLVTARLYCSFETPYATIFLVLLLTRLFHKINARAVNAIERFAISTDCLLIALHYRLSFRPSFWDPQCAPIYATAIGVACYTAGALTARQSQLQQECPKATPDTHDVHVRCPVFTQKNSHPIAQRAHCGYAGHNALRLNMFH